MYLETARNQLISDSANSVAEYSLNLYGRIKEYKDLFKVETDLTNSLYVRSGMVLLDGKKIINNEDRFRINVDLDDLTFNTNYFIIMRVNMSNPDNIEFFIRTTDVLQYNDNLFNNDSVGVKEVILARFLFSSTGQITNIVDEIPLMINNTDVFLNNQATYSGHKVTKGSNNQHTITLFNVVYVYNSTQYYVESVDFNATSQLYNYSTPPFVNMFLAVERSTQKVHGVITPDYPTNALSSPQGVKNGYTYLHLGLTEVSGYSLRNEDLVIDNSRVLVWSGLANIGDTVDHEFSVLPYTNRMFVRVKDSDLSDRANLPNAERLNYTAAIRLSGQETTGNNVDNLIVGLHYIDTTIPLERRVFEVRQSRGIIVSANPISVRNLIVSNLFAEKRRGTTLIIEGGD